MLDARRTRYRSAPLALAGLSLLVWLVVMVVLVHPALVDVRVYRAEGRALLDGLDLYGPLDGVHGVNTYPPFAALLFVPAALAAGRVRRDRVGRRQPAPARRRVLAVDPAGRRAVVASAAVGVLAAVALWSEPVTTSLLYGQINLAAARARALGRDPAGRLAAARDRHRPGRRHQGDARAS